MAVPPGALPRLHVITDTSPGVDTLGAVRAALSAGAPLIQVRVEDAATDRAAFDLALRVAALCADHAAICLVNDRLHVALAVGAHGGHVGAEDLPVDAARRVLGPKAIVGGTCREPDAGRSHRRAGASYLGVGPAHHTSTKDGLPDPLGAAGIRAVAQAVDIPVIAIGGVTPERVPDLLDAGAHGVAVVAAISRAADPFEATKSFLKVLPSFEGRREG
ncbi:thiamine-phosphate synthase [Actinorhabdospora filicis]|uniref:Thiamine-phosphate synthase n=1 Tax=Actinorhabdospora filicis TaxID=1785913 RepID=A0A9W6SUE6_9ACTN|nr:thiamine phosphate synthase [Actinorhabdospora filicis]GLZ80936.1 thiamine-phosphate synthase [Actinorhabdospora filicis]